MELHDERPISVQLPDTIEATIVEADAVVKGQTASSSYKPAMLDNGVRVMVPPHISAGTQDRRRRLRANLREARRLMVSHSGLITVMTRAVRKAAPRLRRDYNEVEQLQVSKKGPADFVSMADKRAETTLVEELRNARPDWGMLLEEGGAIEGDPSKPRWIVDPLDGTTNFLHGVPHFSISIAVEEPLPGGQDGHQPRPRLSAADRRDLLGGKGPWCLAQRPAASSIGASRPGGSADRNRHSPFRARRCRALVAHLRRDRARKWPESVGWDRPHLISPGSRRAGSMVSGKTISTSGIRRQACCWSRKRADSSAIIAARIACSIGANIWRRAANFTAGCTSSLLERSASPFCESLSLFQMLAPIGAAS